MHMSWWSLSGLCDLLTAKLQMINKLWRVDILIPSTHHFAVLIYYYRDRFHEVEEVHVQYLF